MTLTFDRPEQLQRPDADWFRDDAGRPWILPDPDWDEDRTAQWLAGRAKDGRVPYTRVTTYVEALLDGTMLARWKMRRVALGMGRRPDYVVAAAALTAEDRDRDALNDLAEKALEASGPNAADVGTALHSFTERIDRGEPLGFVPPEYARDLDAYREAVQSIQWAHREERMVCDALETAGTPDGLGYVDQPDPDGVLDELRVIDLKTGNVERTAGKFSAQLGVYANSALYDPRTGTRTWLDVNTRWGLVLHMPAGMGTAQLRWLNLQHGWLGAQLAGPVRKWRTVTHGDLMRPLVAPEPRTVPDGKCAGRKRDGEPCTMNAKADGFCGRHADQVGTDPDAAVSARTAAVAEQLQDALQRVPQPLRLVQPATVVLPGDELADREDRPASTAVDPAVEKLPVEQNGNPRPHSGLATPDNAQDAAQNAELALMDQVRACRTAGELTLLWEATGPAWTPAVRAYAKRHVQLMPQQAQAEKVGAALLASISAARTRAELHRLWWAHQNIWTDEHSAAARTRAGQLPA